MSIIAISRGTFSGGEALAQRVAERLGYRCVSREIILEAAWGYGVAPEEVMTAMDKRPPLWKRLAGERQTHLALVRAALCGYAVGGNLVYHGYLGHLFLPGIAHVIAVRAIADLEYRLQAAMQQRESSRREATRYIERVDRERRLWTRFLFDVEWDDPGLYDLVLNLSRMSLETACAAVAALTDRPEFRPTEASLGAMRDLTLASQVSAALVSDRRTKGAHVGVTAENGHVRLSGTTQSPLVVQDAALVVRQVPGVKAVTSDVRLLREGQPPAA